MYYQEKKTIATLISGLLILIAYGVYVYQKYQEGIINFQNDLKFWASTMLIFIGIGIVATIVILILFHILNEIINTVKNEESDDPMVEDEMDKLISLKAERNSYVIVGVGFVASLVSIITINSPALMLNIIFLSFLLGSIFEGFSQLYFYKKGI